MGSENKKCLKVLMFPWLAHGHISPFIELAKKLSQRNFHCYICSTPVNLNSIKNKIPEKYSVSIHLLEFHLPTLPELPPHYHTTSGLPLDLHPALGQAVKMAKPNFSNLVKSLQPDLLVHDIFQGWAAKVASRHNIPSVTFMSSGATMMSYFSMAVGYMEDYKNAERDADEEDEAFWGNNEIILVSSSREIEGKYMDYISELTNKEIIPIGVLVDQDYPCNQVYDDDSEIIMEWLRAKDEFSTVFVSFGSEYFLNKEEIEEMAIGLELSNVKFIWVVRFPKGEEMGIEEALPKGFIERVGDRGKIESIYYGVPIIAMPMHRDQPMNAKLVVELGVGVEVKRDDDGKFRREEISKVIRDVVIGESGENVRRKVGEKRESVRLRSREEVEEVAHKLAQLCVV
ncbi:hypothetical protein DH2020_028282 [Rehmannia glutinosa]|uniref:Glycosyltransferase N-terminal domain-containing protein n=1 Tax=Rehmannia glutinosa TaxID=99300 RepID=A0ABR0VTK0_REHGL